MSGQARLPADGSNPSRASNPARRPRVLEVLFSFRIGGSELVGLELAHQLSLAGAEVMCTSVTGLDGPLRERCERLGLTVLDLGFPVSDILSRNGFSLALARRLAALRLDAIHLQHFLTLLKFGLPARIARIPRIVVTEHADARLRESLGQRLRVRMMWRLAHSITVIHPGLKHYFVSSLDIPESRVQVIPNGIDICAWQRADREERRAELGLKSEFAFVFVGRVDAVKNVPGLIRAFLEIQPRLPRPSRLLVVGSGHDLANCEAVLRNHPLGHTVCLVGEQLDTRRYLAAADAFVLNSTSEGLPRALLEAMSMGLPAISTAVGGIPAVLGGRGWLTNAADPTSLAGALIEVATNTERAAEYGARAQAFVTANYDHRRTLRSYQDILRLGTTADLNSLEARQS